MFTQEFAFGEAPALPVVTEEWRKRLMEAAQRIRQHGLHKKGFVSPETGAYCVLGAIYDAAIAGCGTTLNGNKPCTHAADVAFTEYLATKFGFTKSVPEWNDADERTAEEVIFALEDCAVNFVP